MKTRSSRIATERLELQPVTLADAGAFFDHARIPEVAKNAGFLPKSISETKAYLRRSMLEWRMGKPERMTFSILLRPEGRWIGSLEMRWLYEGIGEIGFFIHPSVQGNGYATEAARAALDWAFRHCDAHRVQGSCWVKNRPSMRVLRKLGLRKEGRLRGYVRHGDSFQDDYLFGITLSDWQKRHRSGWRK